ncbi:acetylxylan esterase [Mucilaginibacter defluvii]
MNKILTFIFAICMSVALPVAAYSQTPEHEEGGEAEGEVFLDIKPKIRNAIFNDPAEVAYDIKVKSTYKEVQEGKVSYELKTDYGKHVSTDSVKVKIGPGGSKKLSFKIPAKTPGFYELSFRFNLSLYDDTVRRVFGVRPDQIVAENNRPADFVSFWQKTRDSLSKVPPKYRVLERKDLSTPKITVYLVEMRSWNNALIRGWLTIPKNRPKKLPVRYRVPGYLVTMEPSMMEDDFAVFSINVRGNGNSKDAINTKGIQYNLYNIGDRNNYVYRAVYMDCLRGVDFIASHQDMGLDTSRISIDGGSQGGALAIVVAALDKRIKLVTTEVPLYSDIHNAVRISKAMHPNVQTPVWYMNNYVSQKTGFTEQRLFKTWDYFDPLNFAGMVRCPVLMGIGLLDELCPPSCSIAMYNRLATQKKELWVTPDKGHEVDGNYYRFQYQWLREYFLLP